jgi:hypothetical protein
MNIKSFALHLAYTAASMAIIFFVLDYLNSTGTLLYPYTAMTKGLSAANS